MVRQNLFERKMCVYIRQKLVSFSHNGYAKKQEERTQYTICLENQISNAQGFLNWKLIIFNGHCFFSYLLCIVLYIEFITCNNVFQMSSIYYHLFKTYLCRICANYSSQTIRYFLHFYRFPTISKWKSSSEYNLIIYFIFRYECLHKRIVFCGCIDYYK